VSSYLVLLYRDEAAIDAMSEQERAAMLAAHQQFRARHGSAVGVGHALRFTDTARSIRPGPDGQTITDGPFVETKEALGGFYLIEAEDLDAAVAIAADVPTPVGV
jgi:hypothetical protein